MLCSNPALYPGKLFPEQRDVQKYNGTNIYSYRNLYLPPLRDFLDKLKEHHVYRIFDAIEEELLESSGDFRDNSNP